MEDTIIPTTEPVMYIAGILTWAMSTGNYSENTAIISPILFTFALLPIIPIIRGLGHNSERVDKKKSQAEDNDLGIVSVSKVQCYYCSSDETLSADEQIHFCMKCGKELLICEICGKFVNHKERTLKLEPCQHIFHRKELLDWMEQSDECPKCQVLIESVDTHIY
ncbi:MAG: RING finger domain-containing protein [Candidatus Heimdallarchaeaceae archaeon]